MEGSSFSAIKSSQLIEEIKLDGRCHNAFYNQSNNKFYICYSNYKSVDVYDGANPNKLELFKKVSLELKKPKTLCINTENKIFIACELREGIFVFDENFNFLNRFGQNVMQDDVDYMCIDYDDTNKTSFLYISSYGSCKVTKWNCSTGELINELDIPCPSSSLVKNEKLFVISESDEVNCVLEINKYSLETINSISIGGWLELAGICFDNASNLIVTAKQCLTDETKYLFVFSPEGALLNKICLDEFGHVLDMTLGHNCLLILAQELDFEFYLRKFTFN